MDAVKVFIFEVLHSGTSSLWIGREFGGHWSLLYANQNALFINLV